MVGGGRGRGVGAGKVLVNRYWCVGGYEEDDRGRTGWESEIGERGGGMMGPRWRGVVAGG